MCFMTTPYHFPVKRPDTRASYLKQVTRHVRWEAEELEQFGRIRCNADSSHKLGDPAHEAVGTERTRHAAIIADCCWCTGTRQFFVCRSSRYRQMRHDIAGEMHTH